jgi:hypothetical protein
VVLFKQLRMGAKPGKPEFEVGDRVNQ